MNPRRKGQRLEAQVWRHLRADGAWVEPAPAVIRRIGGRVFSTRHDWFTLFDAVYVRDGVRGFVQVTTPPSAAAKRQRLLASGFPCTAADLLVLYRGRATFDVYTGPSFITRSATWVIRDAALTRSRA